MEQSFKSLLFSRIVTMTSPISWAIKFNDENDLLNDTNSLRFQNIHCVYYSLFSKQRADYYMTLCSFFIVVNICSAIAEHFRKQYLYLNAIIMYVRRDFQFNDYHVPSISYGVIVISTHGHRVQYGNRYATWHEWDHCKQDCKKDWLLSPLSSADHLHEGSESADEESNNRDSLDPNGNLLCHGYHL